MGGPETSDEPLAELRNSASSTEKSPTAKPSSTDTAPASDQGSALDSTSTPPDPTTSAANQEQPLGTFAQNATLPPIDTLNTKIPTLHIRTPSRQTPKTPLASGLHIQTDITGSTASTISNLPVSGSVQGERELESRAVGSSSAQSQPIAIEGGLRSNLSAASMYSASQYSLSPASSRISSPAINALPDITPLPSPIPIAVDSTWKKTHSRDGSAGSLGRSLREEVLLDQAGERPSSSSSKFSPSKMKQKNYGGLTPGSSGGGSGSPSQSRSLSEFKPEAMHNERPRNVTVGTEGELMQIDSALHREKYLAEQRGLAAPAAAAPGTLPTPPPSNRSVTESEGDDVRDEANFVEYLTVREGFTKTRRKYRTVRPLGQGTFSKVVLATSQKIPPTTALDATSENWLDPKNLVAVKIVQHGPAGGADTERVDLGLRREIDILKTLDHPTLIHLKAFDWNDQEALIVLNYCAGGDLFDLASQHRNLLTPPVVQRMFAEMVDALHYLHSRWIVHRDIKLENVLLNPTPAALAEIKDPLTYPYPLITLTDLGLSRSIPQPPDSPLLTTRCGSEDYAAPEILLGQPYDGRQTDAWALGVLTYALVEGRLPFDLPPPRPGSRINRRGRTTHRIARCDWIWAEYGDDDGDWDPVKGAEWEGAREVIEGLLKKVTRGRLTLEELAEKPYVKSAIPDDGLRRPPHADDEES